MPLTAEEFRKRIEALERIEFDADAPAEERTIPAEWIVALFPEPARVATHPIRLKHAIIEGNLTLRHVRAPYDVEIVECEVTGSIDVRGATVERLFDLSRTRFRDAALFAALDARHDVDLAGCIFEKNVWSNDIGVARILRASGTQFRGAASFERARVTVLLFRPLRTNNGVEPTRFEQPARFHDLRAQYLDAAGVQFATDVDFNGMAVEGVTYFLTAPADDDLVPIEPIVARFGGRVSFRQALFGTELNFAGTQFAGPVVFHAMRVRGRMILEASNIDPSRYRTRFDADADFTGMEVEENLYAGGCTFKGACVMVRMKVAGSANFVFALGDKAIAAEFDGALSFGESDIGRYTDFRSVTFRGPASFIGTHIRNTLSFARTEWASEQRATVFEQDVTFYRMKIDRDFWCEGAEFRGGVDCLFMDVGGIIGLVDDYDGVPVRSILRGTVRFDGTHAGDLRCNGVRFPSDASFRGIRIRGIADLEGAQFGATVDLRGADVRGKLSLESAEIAGDLMLRDAHAEAFTAPATLTNLDARGFTFQRIEGDVRALLRKQDPYDLQIYERIETALRHSGDQDVAGAMYVDRRRRETRAHWQEVVAPGTKLTRRLMELLLALYGNVQDLLFRYGVRPLRLVVLSVLVLGFGTWVFSQPGAVRLRDKPDQPRTLSGVQALGYSARVFMPVGDLPAGAGLVPTEQTLPRLTLTYEAWATIQRLLGLLLVPLGIASITGVLVRKR